VPMPIIDMHPTCSDSAAAQPFHFSHIVSDHGKHNIFPARRSPAKSRSAMMKLLVTVVAILGVVAQQASAFTVAGRASSSVQRTALFAKDYEKMEGESKINLKVRIPSSSLA